MLWREHSGAILVEFAIAIPFMLLLASGVLNISSLLWQVQVMSEAVRHSARIATIRSNDGLLCSDITEIAQDEIGSYLDDYSLNTGLNLNDRWATPNICFFQASWEDYTASFIKVSMETDSGNCVLCFSPFSNYIASTVEATYKLEWPCGGGLSPEC